MQCNLKGGWLLFWLCNLITTSLRKKYAVCCAMAASDRERNKLEFFLRVGTAKVTSFTQLFSAIFASKWGSSPLFHHLPPQQHKGIRRKHSQFQTQFYRSFEHMQYVRMRASSSEKEMCHFTVQKATLWNCINVLHVCFPATSHYTWPTSSRVVWHACPAGQIHQRTR